MGSWGTGIMQDDTVLDIISEFKDSLKDKKSVEEASELLISKNKELIDDLDQKPTLLDCTRKVPMGVWQSR